MNNIRPFLFFTILAAIIIAGTSALFSVTGISSLFAGHKLQVAIMAGSLEAGKIMMASIIYRYWKVMARMMKIYMIISLLMLMVITSAGIFGYLSDAYQKTKSDYTIIEKQVIGLNLKRDRFTKNIKDYQLEKEQLDKQINNLIIALQTNKITYHDTSGRLVTTQSLSARKLYKAQLEDIRNRKQLITEKIDVYSDSVMSINSRSITLESKNIKGDIGPLLYLSVAFDTDMDTVAKWFIFILIFVFDPLAITLIVAANMIYINKHYERTEWIDMFKKDKDTKNLKKDDVSTSGDKSASLEEDEFFEMEHSPADKNDTSNISSYNKEKIKPEAKSKAQELNGDEETKNTKQKPDEIHRKWSSANWIEPYNLPDSGSIK